MLLLWACLIPLPPPAGYEAKGYTGPEKHSQQSRAMLSSAGYWEYEPELLASILAPAQWLAPIVCSDQAAIFEKES